MFKRRVAYCLLWSFPILVGEASADEMVDSILPTPSGLSAVLGAGLTATATVYLPDALSAPIVISVGTQPGAGTGYVLGTADAHVDTDGATTQAGTDGGAANVAIAAAFAAAATAPDGTAISVSQGFGVAWGLSFSNITGGPASASGNGTGGSSASVNPSVPSATASSNGDGSSAASAGGAGGASTTADASVTADVNASSLAGTVTPIGFNVDNSGGQTTATFALPDDNHPIPDQAFFADGNGLPTTVDFSISGNNSGIRTTGDGDTAVSTTAVFGSFGVAEFRLGGAGSFLETSGDRAAGLQAFFSGAGDSSLAVDLTGQGSHIATGGANAPGVLMIGNGPTGSSTQIGLSGLGSHVDTAGEGSHAAALISLSDTMADSGFSLSGSGSYLSTGGDEAFGVWLQSFGDVAHAQGNLTGQNSQITTTGDYAIGAVELGHGDLESNVGLGLGGGGANILTTGADALGALLVGVGATASTVSFEAAGTGSGIETRGARSAGAVLLAESDDAAMAHANLSGQGSSIRTSGENAYGLFMASHGDSAMSHAELSGMGSSIVTTGDYAHGFVGLASSSTSAFVELVLNGRSSSIRTTGFGAAGAVVMAGIASESAARLSLTGASASIITAGDAAPGVVIGGNYGVIKLLGNKSSIQTSGAGSDGIFIDGSYSLTQLASNSTIATSGANSAAINLFADTTDHLILNQGHLLSAQSIAVSGSDGADTLWNSGAIFGGGGVAFNLGAGNDALGLLAGSRIIGLMDLGAGTNRLLVETGKDASAIWHINGELLPENVTVTGGAPYVLLAPDLNHTDNIIAIIDPTAVTAGSDITFNLSQALVSGTTTRFSEFGFSGSPSVPTTGSAPLAYAPEGTDVSGAFAAFPSTDTDLRTDASHSVWVVPFGGVRDFADDAPFLGATHRFAGVTGGVDGEVSDALRLGMFAGGAVSRFDVDRDSQHVDSDVGNIGSYAYWSGNSYFVAGVWSAGLANNESRRLVLNNLAPNGTETARAEFGSWYVRPELHVGTRHGLTQRLEVVPTASLDFTASWVDGYTESGSSANLQVDSHDAQILGAQASLPLVYRPATERPLQLMARGEVFGSWTLDGAVTDVALLGQNFAVNPRNEDLAGIGVGAGFRYGTFGAATLFGSVDVRVANDNSVGASATGGLRVPF